MQFRCCGTEVPFHEVKPHLCFAIAKPHCRATTSKPLCASHVFLFILFYCWDVVPNPTKGAAFGIRELFEKSSTKNFYSFTSTQLMPPRKNVQLLALVGQVGVQKACKKQPHRNHHRPDGATAEGFA